MPDADSPLPLAPRTQPQLHVGPVYLFIFKSTNEHRVLQQNDCTRRDFFQAASILIHKRLEICEALLRPTGSSFVTRGRNCLVGHISVKVLLYKRTPEQVS